MSTPVRLLLGLALALRVGWVVYCWCASGPALNYPDEELHWQLAGNLVHDGCLVSDDGRFAARMPVYPLFLALFAWLGANGILVARLAQAVLGAGTVILAYRLADAAAGRRAALIAGLLVCCDPFAIFFTNLLLSESLFTLVLLGLVACAWHLIERALTPDTRVRRYGALVGLAVLGPLAIMTRPSAAGLIPLLWLLVLWLAADGRRALGRWLLCPVLMVVLMLPWGLRNKAAVGSFAWLSTNGGVTLYDGQGPQADGSSNQAFLKEMPALRGLDEAALDRTLGRLAVEQMWAHPGNVLRLAGVKFLRMWSPTPNVAEYRGGIAAVAGATYTVVLLVGAATGLVRTVRRRSFIAGKMPAPRFMLLLWLPVVYFTLVHCVYIGSVRYRVPLLPLLAVAAATTIPRLSKPCVAPANGRCSTGY